MNPQQLAGAAPQRCATTTSPLPLLLLPLPLLVLPLLLQALRPLPIMPMLPSACGASTTDPRTSAHGSFSCSPGVTWCARFSVLRQRVCFPRCVCCDPLCKNSYCPSAYRSHHPTGQPTSKPTWKVRDRDFAIDRIEDQLRKLSADPTTGVQFVEGSRWMTIFEEVAFLVSCSAVQFFVMYVWW